ncbi:MAG: DUF2807 domain-containing protein [Flavobacterium sp.]|uniref:head GIN domain-containing protein n=1 Tax=Flavobacterium sp. TaxID=239 RepID=UPI001DF7075C|nr:DUF2807 domain-containing protein [Flavobacterium sp.]
MIKFIVYLTRIIIVFITALLFNSCQYSIDLGDAVKGNGNVTTVNRPVSGEFTNIEVSHGIDVEVTQSNAKSIQVKADDNIIDYITTDIVDGTLRIALEKSVKNTKSKKVFVTLPNIESLRTSSGALIESKNTLVVSELETKASSGSEIKLDVEAERITCETSSGSDIQIKGKALKLEAESSSGSEIEANDLLANDVTAKSSSGSSINVNPILSLNAKASSGGDIRYHSTPKTISKVTSSGGSVRSN